MGTKRADSALPFAAQNFDHALAEGSIRGRTEEAHMTGRLLSRGRGAIVTATLLALQGCAGTETLSPTTNGSSSDVDRAALSGPESALMALEQAYSSEDLRAIQRLFAGRYVFHTHPEFLGVEELSRGQSVRVLQSLFRDPEVVSVSLDLEFGPPESAGDLEHPDWLQFDVDASYLDVLIRRKSGEEVLVQVEGTPARFIVARGPSVGQTSSWQIIAQWDLYESDSQDGERASASVTWSELLVTYLDGVAPDGGR
jgi:hypothetical protein